MSALPPKADIAQFVGPIKMAPRKQGQSWVSRASPDRALVAATSLLSVIMLAALLAMFGVIGK